MERTKILFIITKSNFGGAQRYVFDLATNLPQDAYDVAVAFGGSGALKEKLAEAGIRTSSIKSFGRDVNLWKEIQSLRELYTLMGTERPDVVHLNSSKAGGSGALIARMRGVKNIVFTAHGWPFFEQRSFVWKFLAWFFSYLTALLAHQVIVVSKNDLTNVYMPFVQKKFALIHTAVPRIHFLPKAEARSVLYSESERNMHASDIWITTNAELTQNKNLFFAVDAVIAWNRTHERKIFYTIISDGELYESLNTHIHNNNAHLQIQLIGYLPEARRYLRAFDIFLLPSLKEGMPYALLEAGAAGLPSIASNVGGIPELISHEKSGLLIDPTMQQDLIAAFQKLIDSPILQNEYGSKLQQKVMVEYTLDQMTEKTLQIYNSK